MNIFTINNNTGSCKSQACSPASRSSVGQNWMLRLFSLLLVLCMSCGAAWALSGFEITEYRYEDGLYKVKFYVTTNDNLGAWMRVIEQGNESNEVRAQASGILGTRNGFEGQITLSSPNATLVAQKRNVLGVWLTGSQKTSSVSESDFMKIDLDNFTYANTYVGVIRTDTLSCTARVTSSLNLENVQFTWKYPHLLYNKNQNGTSSYKSTEFLEERNTSAERIYYFNTINYNNVPIEVSCVMGDKTYTAKQTVTKNDLVLLGLNDFDREYTDYRNKMGQNNNSDVTFNAILTPGANVSIASCDWEAKVKDKDYITPQFINPSGNQAQIKLNNIQQYYYFINGEVKDANNKSYTVTYELREGDLAVINFGSAYIFDNSDGTNHFSQTLTTRYNGAFNTTADAVWSDNKGWTSPTVKTNQSVNSPLYMEESDIILNTFDKEGRRHKVTRHGMVALWSKFRASTTANITNGQHLAYIAYGSSVAGREYKITNDIDLSGAWWDFASTTFRGKLDGQGYTVRDLTAKCEKENSSYGLFPAIEGTESNVASVKNLTIANSEMEYAVPTLTAGNNLVRVGTLAGVVRSNVEIENCNVVKSSITGNSNCVIDGNRRLYVGGLIGLANSTTKQINNCRVECDIDLSMLRFGGIETTNKGSRHSAGGVFGSLVTPSVVPTNLLYSGKIAAPYAFVGPIFASSTEAQRSTPSADDASSKDYAGENLINKLPNKSVDEVLKAVDTWFYKDYYIYVTDATKNNAAYNTTDDEGATVVPQYNGQYVKCTDEFPAKTYDANKTYKLGGYRSLLYSSTGADGDITKMPYLQGVNLGNYIETDFDEFPFVLYDGDVYDRSKPFTVPSFSYVRTFKNTNWSSVFIPSELEYDDWKDKVDIAKFWDVNVYLPSSSATKPELGVNTEIQVLILAKGDRIKPNVPYLIRLKDEALAGTELWFTHKDYKNGVKVEDADNRKILSCSDVETNFTFYGNYSKDRSELPAKWYALTHEGWWCAASKTAKLSPERVFVTIEGKNATKFYPELYKDGEPLFRDEMKAPTLRINVLNESEEMGETAIEQIAQNYGNEGDEVTRIPSSVIGLKAGNYVIGGKQIVVE